jgi:hypothetical protein
MPNIGASIARAITPVVSRCTSCASLPAEATLAAPLRIGAVMTVGSMGTATTMALLTARGRVGIAMIVVTMTIAVTGIATNSVSQPSA